MYKKAPYIARDMSGVGRGSKRDRALSTHDSDDDDGVIFVSGASGSASGSASAPRRVGVSHPPLHPALHHPDVMQHAGSFLTVADRGRARVAGIGAIKTDVDNIVRSKAPQCAQCKEPVAMLGPDDADDYEHGPFGLPGDSRVKLCRTCRMRGIRLYVIVEVYVPALHCTVSVPVQAFNKRVPEEQTMANLRDDLLRTLGMSADATTVVSNTHARHERKYGSVPPVSLLSSMRHKLALLRHVYQKTYNEPINVIIGRELLAEDTRTVHVTLRWADPARLLPAQLVDAAHAVMSEALGRLRAPAASGASGGASASASGSSAAAGGGALGGLRRRASDGRFTRSYSYKHHCQ